MHATIMQMKTAEAAMARRVQEQRAAQEAAAADACGAVSDKLKESQQQVRGYLTHVV